MKNPGESDQDLEELMVSCDQAARSLQGDSDYLRSPGAVAKFLSRE